ncbi:MAG: transglutaminase domain-containing protein [Pararhodobacter sp.]
MIYDIRLAISYAYGAPSDRSRMLLRMMPRGLEGVQRVVGGTLAIDPQPDEQREGQDFFGNSTVMAVWHGPIKALKVSTTVSVERLAPVSLADLSPLLTELPAALADCDDLGPDSPHHFVAPSPRVPEVPDITAYARKLVRKGMTTAQAIEGLGRALHRDMTFDSEATSVDTGPEEAFAQRRGVCQDFAHVMIAALRALGVPAGYVSGFLRTLPPPGQPRLEGADAMHAWVRAWAGPVTGWIEFDPTNDQPAGGDYVTVAYGRDYGDVSPVQGTMRTAGRQGSRQAVDMVPRDA